MSDEAIKIIETSQFFTKLLNEDRYIAKSEFINKIDEIKATVDFCDMLISSDMAKDFSKKYKLPLKEIELVSKLSLNVEKQIEYHNKKYIKTHLIYEKEYLDDVLKCVDPQIKLDTNQREVVLTDEDFCLVIAGAGAGKTTTVAAKAKYLVEKKDVNPNEILIVSFTNKAVGELREKINDDLGLECVISTFHSIGNAILKTNNSEKFNIIMENKIYYILMDYFKEKVLTNEELTKKLVMFFASYFDAKYEGDDLGKYLYDLSNAHYTTLKGDIEDFKKEIIDARTKKKITIQNEIVRSLQEVEIANYLYLNNLDYDYEPIYKYNIKYSNKPYTPDFVIRQGDKTLYLEHFGISESGENNLYSKSKLDEYKKCANDKVKLHRDHGTKLIYTFSKYNDGRTITQHLQEELDKAGFTLRRKNDKEVLEKIIETEESRYISRLVILICNFINLFKTSGKELSDFEILRNDTNNVRNKLFLDIAKECYLTYQKYLKENNSIDFQDMINDSAKKLREMADRKQKLRFKYVIVDEYQDISKQRFDLVSALHDVCDAKIVAVGDDWQSIYAFSGSDVELFLDFEKKMGYAKQLKIENTYRNSQEIIDIAGNFIQKNKSQIRKILHSPKHIVNPITIYTYDPSRKQVNSNNKNGIVYNIAEAVQKSIEDILRYNKLENKRNGDVLLLGRYNMDSNDLQNSGLFEIAQKGNELRCVKYPNIKLVFMTAHASKGLGFDNVIVLNGKNDKYGFPSKIDNDPVMQMIQKTDNSYTFAEERRLFYVAMTRTKNRVFCIAPQEYPSEFLLEIKRDYENVVLKGEWNEEIKINTYKKSCPVCGYPMQYKYKAAYGLRLNICTNEPEVCGFMTNDIKGGKLQIMKCDQCADGYLVVKTGNGKHFLGCTNYKNDGKGCNNVISETSYYEMMNFTPNNAVEGKENNLEVLNKGKDVKNFKVDVNGKKIIVNPESFEYCGDLFCKAAITVLSSVNTIGQKQYFGVTKICDILIGKELEKKYEPFTKIPEFGSMLNIERIKIEALIYALINNGLLLKTKSHYPVLHLTIKSQDFIKEKNKKDLKSLFFTYKQILKKMKNE